MLRQNITDGNSRTGGQYDSLYPRYLLDGGLSRRGWIVHVQEQDANSFSIPSPGVAPTKTSVALRRNDTKIYSRQSQLERYPHLVHLWSNSSRSHDDAISSHVLKASGSNSQSAKRLEETKGSSEVKMIATENLEWIAGFLEAEGSFQFSSGKHLSVSAQQIEREPLDYLVHSLGGYLYHLPARKEGRNNPIFSWSVVSSRAAGVMMTLYPLMGPKGQLQIKSAIGEWKKTIPYQFRTHCPSGHPYSGDNLYVWNGGRSCRECSRRNQRNFRLRNKNAL